MWSKSLLSGQTFNVIVDLKPNEAEEVCNYAKYNSILTTIE